MEYITGITASGGSWTLLKNPVVVPTGTKLIEVANLDIPVDDIMHSPELTIDSDKWLTDAIMFEGFKASHMFKNQTLTEEKRTE